LSAGTTNGQNHASAEPRVLSDLIADVTGRGAKLPRASSFSQVFQGQVAEIRTNRPFRQPKTPYSSNLRDAHTI